MRSVDMSALESELEAYIAYAQAGERIVILENGTAVAMLVPMDLPESEPGFAAMPGDDTLG